MDASVLAGFAGTITTIVVSLVSLAYWLGRRFAEVDRRFAELERRVEAVERRLDAVERRLDALERRIEAVERRLDAVEGRLERIVSATRGQFEFFAEFLGYRGVLEARDVEFVKSELARLGPNPMSESELRRIRELVEKGELTLEEANELLSLARRFVDEHGDKPIAWKLLIYAAVMRGAALRKLKESQQ